MKSLENWFTILTALISAAALLGGYVLQKSAERGQETRKTQQEIYSRLISNITERNTLLGRFEQTPEYKNANQEEQKLLGNQFQLKDAELTENEGEREEIVAKLCVYGTNEAINAYVEYASANASGTGGDLGKIVVKLRQSIVKTDLDVQDADLAIWGDPKYLKKPSLAR